MRGIIKELQETYNIFINHIIEIGKGKDVEIKERRYYGIILIILSIIIMLI